MARLIVVDGPDLGTEFELERPPSGETVRLTIGRDPRVALTLADSAVSREHCRVDATTAGFRLVDLESRNRTYLNADPVERCWLENGDRLVAAWRQLAARHGPEALPLLVFAGSGRREQIETKIPRSLEERLVFVRSPSDADLRSLYRGALFCVFPSLHEGWGLPVGEALWHGRLCVTSSTSSLPEVAGPLADYVDPSDVASRTPAAAVSAADVSVEVSVEVTVEVTVDSEVIRRILHENVDFRK